ncbi:ATP-grasp domain-containing protein [Brevibacillus humidisoli]|uniref:ATP-grasp domain-containing protein n=1 Tax=Brevibacillus humidisoli TaxID=2895522 RepID=UPI001E4877AE|nr:ATP-grasp domain-containing protein [Brevibacillus humidisoli]UFJ41465.1 ATP-grasp domain-containing protein [Brevibacillus humidisoli]
MNRLLLFVESNTTGTGMLALKKAQAYGVTPVFLTNKPERYLGLAETGCQVLMCDTNSLEELRQTIETRLAVNQLCGIMTTSEFYLVTTAKLAELYGLPGNPPEAMEICRNKAKTRQRLSEEGVEQPRFAIVQDPAQIPAAMAAVGLPCVVKPVDDSGSNDVKLCHTVEQIEQQLAVILAEKLNTRGQQRERAILIEEYLDDPEFSVEMFTYAGQTISIGITQKQISGTPFFVEHQHIFPAQLSTETAEQIKDTVLRALTAVGIQNGATHTEVKVTSKGCAIIEINARLAGGMIPELIHQATGIDLLEQQIKAAMGECTIHKQEVASKEYAGIHFFLSEQEGTFQRAEGIERVRNMPGIHNVTITAREGGQVHVAQNAYHRLGYVIASGTTYTETEKRLTEAVRQIALVLEERQEAVPLLQPAPG